MDSSQSIRERLHRRRRQKYWRLLRLLIGTFLLATGVYYGWGYIHSPNFAFGTVSIHGTSQLTERDVIDLSGAGKPPLNLFNASTGRLKDALNHDVRFKSAEVAYRFPSTLQVIVEEREPALYVANSYHSYLKLDYNGVVISVTASIPDAKAPVLVGVQCGNIYIGDTVDNFCIQNILKFLQQLDPEALKCIGEITVDGRQEVKLRMTNSFPILLGSAKMLPEKAIIFMTVFNEIKDKNIKAEYIDLTFAKPYIKLLPSQADSSPVK